MTTTQPENEMVDDVYNMKVTGANVMLGVYPDGDTELTVYTADGATVTGASWDVEDGLLPPAATEVDD